MNIKYLFQVSFCIKAIKTINFDTYLSRGKLIKIRKSRIYKVPATLSNFLCGTMCLTNVEQENKKSETIGKTYTSEAEFAI